MSAVTKSHLNRWPPKHRSAVFVPYVRMGVSLADLNCGPWTPGAVSSTVAGRTLL